MRYLSCKFFLILLSFQIIAETDNDNNFIHPIYANNYIGQIKVVCGKVKSTYINRKSRNDPLYLNFHKKYPFSPFTAIIWTKYSGDEFGSKPEKRLLNKKLCIKGLIEEYNGKPQIILRYAEQIIEN